MRAEFRGRGGSRPVLIFSQRCPTRHHPPVLSDCYSPGRGYDMEACVYLGIIYGFALLGNFHDVHFATPGHDAQEVFAESQLNHARG